MPRKTVDAYIEENSLLDVVRSKTRLIKEYNINIFYKAYRLMICEDRELGKNWEDCLLVFPGYEANYKQNPQPYLFVGSIIDGILNIDLCFEIKLVHEDIPPVNRLNQEEKDFLIDMIGYDDYYFPTELK